MKTYPVKNFELFKRSLLTEEDMNQIRGGDIPVPPDPEPPLPPEGKWQSWNAKRSLVTLSYDGKATHNNFQINYDLI